MLFIICHLHENPAAAVVDLRVMILANLESIWTIITNVGSSNTHTHTEPLMTG